MTNRRILRNSSHRGIEEEYSAMRAEILTRIQLRQKISASTLTLSGVLLGIGFQHPQVALLLPPLATFLAFAWAQNDERIREISRYIREHIEPKIPNARWESWLRENRSKHGLSRWRYIVLSHGGIVLFTQLFSLYIGLIWLLGTKETINIDEKLLGWMLVSASIISISLVVWILKKEKR